MVKEDQKNPQSKNFREDLAPSINHMARIGEMALKPILESWSRIEAESGVIRRVGVEYQRLLEAMSPDPILIDIVVLLNKDVEEEEEERTAAAQRLVHRLPLGLKNPKAQHALWGMAKEQGKQPDELLQVLLLEGIFIAAGETKPRRIRLGRKWVRHKVTEETIALVKRKLEEREIKIPSQERLRSLINKVFLNPRLNPRHLGAFKQYPHWLFSETYKIATNKLLGRSYPASPQDALERTIAEEGEGLANIAPKLYSPLTPEAILETKDLLTALEAAASPREWAVLLSLLDGCTCEDIVTQLRISPSTVRVHRHHLKKKFKALL